MEKDIKDYTKELATYFPTIAEKDIEVIVQNGIALIRKYCRKGEVALTVSSRNTLVEDNKLGTFIFTRIYGNRAVNNLKKIKRRRDERLKQCK